MADPRQIVKQLTLEEKARLASGSGLWATAEVPHAGVRSAVITDGPHGVRLAPVGDMAHLTDSAPATCFPTAALLGSTRDVDLLREVGAALGHEARDQGVDVLLGPGVNMKRSPLCGRNFEYFAEDPLLAGALGVGSSSRDLPLLTRIRLDVDTPASWLTEDSTLGEWYAHPRGRQVAVDMFGKAMGAEAGRLEDTDIWEFVSQMPVATLLKMSPVDGEQQPAVDLDELLRAANAG